MKGPAGTPYFAPTDPHSDDVFSKVQSLSLQDESLRKYLREERQYFMDYMYDKSSLYRSVKSDIERLCAVGNTKKSKWSLGAINSAVDVVGMELSELGHLYVTIQDEERSGMPVLTRIDADWMQRNAAQGQGRSRQWLSALDHDTIVRWYRKIQVNNGNARQDVPLRLIFDAQKHLSGVLRQREVAHVSRLRMNDTEDILACIVTEEHDTRSICALINMDDGQVIDLMDHCNVVNAEFSSDNRDVYYTVSDYSTQHIFGVARHTIGGSSHHDEVLYRERDVAFFVDLHKTKDKRFITVNTSSKTSSEVRILWNDHLHLIRPRLPNRTYYVEHNGDEFYILNNGDGEQHCPNLRIQTVKSDLDKGLPNLSQAWQDFYTPRESTTIIEDMDMFEKHLVLYVRHQGKSEVRVVDIERQKSGDPAAERTVQLPKKAYTVDPGANNQFHTDHFMITYSSPLTPDTLCTIELGDQHKLHELPQFSSNYGYDAIGFDPEQFEIRSLHVPSSQDPSVTIPLTVVCKKNLDLDGQSPLLLIGYGAYGQSLECRFEPQRLYLLQKAGFVIAFAHVRGGSEHGKQWHDAGRLLNKPNSFYDFIDCAQFLVNRGYTNPRSLCAKGVSSGGLLVAAAANLQPDLFRSVVLKVPFLDITTIMQDPNLPLTEHEYDEFGNVMEDVGLLNLIRGYSPYDNLVLDNNDGSFTKAEHRDKELEDHEKASKKVFPSIYATASIDDFRAPHWNVMKYIMKHRWNQRMDSTKQGAARVPISPLVLFKLDTSGHIDDAGMAGTYDTITQEYVFLLDSMKREKSLEGETRR